MPHFYIWKVFNCLVQLLFLLYFALSTRKMRANIQETIFFMAAAGLLPAGILLLTPHTTVDTYIHALNCSSIFTHILITSFFAFNFIDSWLRLRKPCLSTTMRTWQHFRFSLFPRNACMHVYLPMHYRLLLNWFLRTNKRTSERASKRARSGKLAKVLK